ncbi:unnamed protein product, partial [Symbiodinium sp. KB8]
MRAARQPAVGAARKAPSAGGARMRGLHSLASRASAMLLQGQRRSVGSVGRRARPLSTRSASSSSPSAGSGDAPRPSRTSAHAATTELELSDPLPGVLTPLDADHLAMLNTLRGAIRSSDGASNWPLPALRDAAAAAHRLTTTGRAIPQNVTAEASRRLIRFLQVRSDSAGVVPAVSLLQSLPLRPDALRRCCASLVDHILAVRPAELPDVLAVVMDSAVGHDTALVAEVWLGAVAACLRASQHRVAREILALPGTAAAVGTLPQLAAKQARLPVTLAELDSVADTLAAIIGGLVPAACSRAVEAGAVAALPSAGAAEEAPAVAASGSDSEADSHSSAAPSAVATRADAELALWEALRAEVSLGRAVLRVPSSAGNGDPADDGPAAAAGRQPLAAEPTLAGMRGQGLLAPLGLGAPPGAPDEHADHSAAVLAVAAGLGEQLPFAAVGWRSASLPAAAAGALAAKGQVSTAGAAGGSAEAGTARVVPGPLVPHGSAPALLRALSEVQGARQGGSNAAGGGGGLLAGSQLSVPGKWASFRPEGAAHTLPKMMGCPRGEAAAALLLREALETEDSDAVAGYGATLGAAVESSPTLLLRGRARADGRAGSSASASAVANANANTGAGSGAGAGASTGGEALPDEQAASLAASGTSPPPGPVPDWEQAGLGAHTVEAGCLRVIAAVAADLDATAAGPASAASGLLRLVGALMASGLPVGQDTLATIHAAGFRRGSGKGLSDALVGRTLAGVGSGSAPGGEASGSAGSDVHSRGVTVPHASSAELLVRAALQALCPLGAAGVHSGFQLSGPEQAAAGDHAASSQGAVPAALLAAETALGSPASRSAVAGRCLRWLGDGAAAPRGASGQGAPSGPGSATRWPLWNDEAGVGRATGSLPTSHPLASGRQPLQRTALDEIHRFLKATSTAARVERSPAADDLVWAGCVVLCRAGSLVYARDSMLQTERELDAELELLAGLARQGRLSPPTSAGMAAAVLGLVSIGDVAGSAHLLELASLSAAPLPRLVWEAAAELAARRDAHRALASILEAGASSAFAWQFGPDGSPAAVPLSAEESAVSPYEEAQIAALSSSSGGRQALRQAGLEAGAIGAAERTGLRSPPAPAANAATAASPASLSTGPVPLSVVPVLLQAVRGPAAWAAYFAPGEVEALVGFAAERNLGSAASVAMAARASRLAESTPVLRERNEVALRPTGSFAPWADEPAAVAPSAPAFDAFPAELQRHSQQSRGRGPPRGAGGERGADRAEAAPGEDFWGAFAAATGLRRPELQGAVRLAMQAACDGRRRTVVNADALLRGLESGWMPPVEELVSGARGDSVAVVLEAAVDVVNGVLPPPMRAFIRKGKGGRMAAARDALRLQ